MMFSHLEFYDRIEAVKTCGIDTVEFWKWSNKDIKRIKDSGVTVSIFNMDSADEQLSYDLSRGILNSGRIKVTPFLRIDKNYIYGETVYYEITLSDKDITVIEVN